jgi:uncharacterized protein YoxC
VKVFIVISIVLFLSAFIVLVVYTILTLLQIRNTAKEAEIVLKKLNENLENITDISNKVTYGINTLIPIIASLTTITFSSIVKIIRNLFFRRNK